MMSASVRWPQKHRNTEKPQSGTALAGSALNRHTERSHQRKKNAAPLSDAASDSVVLWFSGERNDARPAARLSLGRTRQHSEVELVSAGSDIDLYLISLCELADEDLLRQRILDVLLDRPLQRPRSEFFIESVLYQERGSRIGELERQLLIPKPLLHFP